MSYTNEELQVQVKQLKAFGEEQVKINAKQFQEKETLKKDYKEKDEEMQELKEQCERWEAEADRTSELECIAWIDFYGEKEVTDDIKPYRFREDILSMKKENKELKEKIDVWKDVCKDFGETPREVEKYIDGGVSNQEHYEVVEELKEQNKELKRHWEVSYAEANKFKEEIGELKAEIGELIKMKAKILKIKEFVDSVKQ